MRSENLVISLNGERGATADPWVRLEQPQVNTGRLTSADLQTMLAMVRVGQSAAEYRQPDCPVSVTSEQMTIPLTFWVWPSDIALAWSIQPELISITSQPKSLRQERDFDLVVEMKTSVDLPFYASTLSSEWQTPSYNNRGEEVERPTITHDGSNIRLSTEVFGVLRIRCTAEGWQCGGDVTFQMQPGVKISDVHPAVTVTWQAPDEVVLTQRLELNIPACAEDLLAYCPDGTTVRRRSRVSSEQVSTIPVVYYSPCDGRVLEVRYELP
jgi:hypothetical protein